ncbi:MAG: cell division protein FtsQ/DivIB [Solirubrobacterales bacterium]
MRRRLAALVLVVVAAAAAYFFLVRDRTAAPTVRVPRPAATIGIGTGAVVVSANGAILSWFPLPEDSTLPELPLIQLPDRGRLAGPMRQQARVLGAVPAALRPYVERSYYGESGVDVMLTSGIELRFGDASQAARKWRAAAAVLANPTITALDYVDLHAPSRPAIWGSGHILPPAP